MQIVQISRSISKYTPEGLIFYLPEIYIKRLIINDYLSRTHLLGDPAFCALHNPFSILNKNSSHTTDIAEGFARRHMIHLAFALPGDHRRIGLS